MSKLLNWKTGVGALVIAAIGWFAFTSFGQDTPDVATADLAADADTATVFVGDLSASATASGQIEAASRSTLSVSSSGLVTEVAVRIGDEVSAGDMLVQLDTTNLELNLASAEQAVISQEARLASLLDPVSEFDVAAAEAEVASAQASYDSLLDGPTAEEIAISEASLAQAQASIYSANATLNNTLSSVTEADIEMAKAAVVSAQIQLDRAIEVNTSFANQQTDDNLRSAQVAYNEAVAKYDRLQNGADSNSVNASAAEVAAAVSRREKSQAELDELLLDPTNTEIFNAQYNLVQAQVALDNLLEGPSEQQIAIAEAELAQAQLNLEAAQNAIEDATIIAPFDGLITAVNFTAGELASGPLVEIASADSLEVVLSVDEADLAVINIGQEAEITIGTWPSLPINSEVVSIAPSAADNSSGITAYDVHVALGDTDLPIKIGMTADARLITEQRADVLLVPNSVINADRQTGQYFVNLIDGETVTEVEITIGLRDSNNTQILSGVDEGDELAIDYEVPVLQGRPGGGGRGN